MRIVALATFFSLATSRGTRSDEIYREKKMLQYANTILEIIRSDVHKAEPSIAAQINAAIESGSSVSVKILTDQFLESADPAKNVDRDEAIAISYARLQEAMTDFNSLMEADRAWRKQLQRNGPEKWSGQVQQSVWRLQRTMRPLRHSNVNAGATWDQNVAGGYYGTRLFVPVLTNDATIYAKYSFVATIGFEAKAIAKEVSIVVDSSVESGGSAAVEPTRDTSDDSGCHDNDQDLKVSFGIEDVSCASVLNQFPDLCKTRSDVPENCPLSCGLCDGCIPRAPVNGYRGTCPKRLARGASCVPSCYEGLRLEGETTCSADGVLSVAACRGGL
eukprot:GEMP01016208.1.p1 GENE.GEMP01016208.1~~GEMP01016208.1.p1  ORF type:complete len:332 (+),score=78.78 GEMP01016208.1:205-1200(+)